MKRKIFLLGLLFLIFLSACTNKNGGQLNNVSNKELASSQNSEKKIIYTTFFPVYDLTKRIVGDKMEIKSIIKGSQEPHDFELQTKDMVEISKGDLIIYNGANMEAFIPSLMDAAGDDSKFLDLSQNLRLLAKKDEISEDTKKVNPHTWLSIKNAMVELKEIYEKVSEMDPENQSFYRENLQKALADFQDLDQKFEDELSKVHGEKYFVVSHAAFNYLAKDYGLRQVAVTGISPEEEPSAKQLKTIADFVNSHDIGTIFFEGKATPKVAETLAKETNTKTATLYTMENLTEEEMERGYLKLMEENLEALVKSFNE